MIEPVTRSAPEVLYRVLGNVQDLLRSELQLAHAELKEEVAEAGRPAVTLGVGLVLAVHAAGLLLLAAVLALAQVMAAWIATLLVGVVTSVLALVLVARGIAAVKRISLRPDRTIASLKETLSWATPQNR